MPQMCAARNCNLSSTKETREQGITFHRFPLNSDARQQWETAIRRDDLVVNSYSRLCSKHFRDADFDRTGQTTRLRDGVVPSLFDFSAGLIKVHDGICCFVNGCSNKYQKNSKRVFHRFPFQSQPLFEKWTDAVNRDDINPTMNSFVCSDHFKDSDYNVAVVGRKKRYTLKRRAVPCVFGNAGSPKSRPWQSPEKVSVNREHFNKENSKGKICCAVDCKSKSSVDTQKTFHCFPKNPRLQKKWVTNINRKNWEPSDDSVLCSDHFEDTSFRTTGPMSMLLPGAVPTLFTQSSLKVEDKEFPEDHPVCCVPKCRSGFQKDNRSTFYAVPHSSRNKELFKNIKIDITKVGFRSASASYVCSEHFAAMKMPKKKESKESQIPKSSLSSVKNVKKSPNTKRKRKLECDDAEDCPPAKRKCGDAEVNKCSVDHCKSEIGKDQKQFHRFPRNNRIRQKWIDSLKYEHWEPSDSSVICSDHFEETCYDFTENKAMLMPGAVPTLFSQDSSEPKQFLAVKTENEDYLSEENLSNISSDEEYEPPEESENSFDEAENTNSDVDDDHILTVKSKGRKGKGDVKVEKCMQMISDHSPKRASAKQRRLFTKAELSGGNGLAMKQRKNEYQKHSAARRHYKMAADSDSEETYDANEAMDEFISQGDKDPSQHIYILPNLSIFRKRLDLQIENPDTEKKWLMIRMARDKSFERRVNSLLIEISSLKKETVVNPPVNRKLELLQGKAADVDSEHLLDIVIQKLRRQNLLSDSGADILEKSYSGLSSQIIRALLKNISQKKLTSKSMPFVMKSFALTLYFYSIEVYAYIRKQFKTLCLPPSVVLRRSYNNIHGEPGFTAKTFMFLKEKVSKAVLRKEEVVCGLMITEMPLDKCMKWDGKHFYGFVDVGSGLLDDSLPLATEAILLMVVSFNDNWKFPCGYFLAHGLSSEERSNIVKICLLKLHDVGVNVVSLTSDIPSCHFNMLENLGARLRVPDVVTSFPHPSDPSHVLHIVFDSCSLLKLLWITLNNCGSMVTGTGEIISWQYIVELEQVLKGESSEATRLKRQVFGQYSSTKLSTKTFDLEIANALEVCLDVLKLEQFKGCKATVEFIRKFDRLFSCLNCLSNVHTGAGTVLSSSTKSEWVSFCNEMYNYITQLTDIYGTPMCDSRKKVPFIGLLVTMNSVLDLYSLFVKEGRGSPTYFSTSRLSLDHLYMYCLAINLSCGLGNNPTAQQLSYTYKRLIYCQNSCDTDNSVRNRDHCTLQHILDIGFANFVDILDMSMIRRYDFDVLELSKVGTDFSHFPDFSVFSEYKDEAVKYFANLAVKKVSSITPCLSCHKALDFNRGNVSSVLHAGKTSEKLISSDIFVVCYATENHLQRLRINSCNLSVERSIPRIMMAVLNDVGMSGFSCLWSHMFDSPPDSNHIFKLIKCLIGCYIQVRLQNVRKVSSWKPDT